MASKWDRCISIGLWRSLLPLFLCANLLAAPATPDQAPTPPKQITENLVHRFIIDKLGIADIETIDIGLEVYQRLKTLGPDALDNPNHRPLIHQELFSPESADPIARVFRYLQRSRYPNCSLLGLPGVGKSHTRQQLAAFLTFGIMPDYLKEEIRYTDDLNEPYGRILNAFVGHTHIFQIGNDVLSHAIRKPGSEPWLDTESRMKETLEELFAAAKREFNREVDGRRVGARTIFLFEEFGDLEPLVLKTLKKITDRGGFQNPTPLPLARPDEGFHVLNLTTPDDFRRLVQGDGSYERRFPPVHIREPDVDAAFRIVRRTASSDWEEKHGPKIEDAAIRFLIHFRRFLTSPPLAMPDSILSVTEQLFTWKTSHPGDDPKNITIQDAQIFLMRKVGLTDVWFEGPNGEPPFYDLEKRVKQHVIGHDKQVHQICEIIKAWARFETGGKVPIILIGGPKGSGKDTIVRALNLVMFGHDGGHLMKSIAGQKGYGINALIEGPPLGNHDDSETGILIQALETGGPGIIGLNEAFDTASIELDKLKDFLGRSEFHPMGRDTRARPLMWPVFILGQFGEQLFPDSMSDDEMARKYAGLSAAEIEGVFIMGKDSGTVGAVPPALIDRVKETGGMFVFTRSPRSDFAAIINTWLPQRQMDLLDRNRIELLPTQNLIQFIIDKSARERLGPRALSGLTRDYTVRVLSRAVDQLLPVYDASVEVDYKNVDGVDTIIVRWLNAKPNHRTEWTFVANQILSTKTVGTVPANCPEELLNVQSSL